VSISARKSIQWPEQCCEGRGTAALREAAYSIPFGVLGQKSRESNRLDDGCSEVGRATIEEPVDDEVLREPSLAVMDGPQSVAQFDLHEAVEAFDCVVQAAAVGLGVVQDGATRPVHS
jgi:hypothetical protein